MRTVERHECHRHHGSAATFARCRWPAARVTGRGFLAVVTSCDDTSIALFERLDPARTHLAELDAFGCCPTCTRDHELFALDIDADQEAAAP